MRICVYEDRRAADLGPLTLTRPVADLLCGISTLGVKHARHFAAEVVGHLCRPPLADLVRTREPLAPVNDPAWLRAAPTVLVNARWLPPARPRTQPPPTFSEMFADGPVLGWCEGEIAFAVLDGARLQTVSPHTLDECLDEWAHALPGRDVGGHVVRRPWELVDHNPGQLAVDFDAGFDPADTGCPPPGFALVGPADRLFIDPTARLDPLVVADTTGGPVVVGPGAVVEAFTRLEGPCSVGAGTHLRRAQIRAGTSIGPHCRVGGEVECSVVLGYTNKYHDGFLGHSYVGEWVNLGAGTTTSDLRVDYRPVTVPLNGVETPTGRTKVGSVIGDHAKTAVNTILNCGTVLGAFAGVLPTGRFAPRDVPSFCRVGPDGVKAEDVERSMRTADTMMRRRGKSLTPELEALYRAVAARVAEVAENPTVMLRKSA